MKVTLIGAGPGDAELMTVKAVKSLACADVVLYDRLVGDEIIAMIPDSAEKINVGKNVNNHPIPQEEITQLMLKKAREGHNVVRLKGGDPFVFGRGGEELELLAEEGIPFEVIPGITSSIAAAMYAGIPITHRDYASSFHVVTGHAKENGDPDINFDSLVKTNGTLVFMMGVSSVEYICRGCLNVGMDKDMPAAIIENATRPEQRKFLGTVSTLVNLAKENAVVSPSVIIIGKVCELSDKLDWFGKKELLGKKILVTRARTNSSNLSAQLRDLGAKVLEVPSIRIVPLLENNDELDYVLENVKRYEWLVFTSGVSVNMFFDYVTRLELDIRKFHHMKIAAVGSETKKELMKRGLTVEYVPEEFSGIELVKGLVPKMDRGERLLLIRAKIGSEQILNYLKEKEILFSCVDLYDTVLENEKQEHIQNMFSNNEVDFVTFTSSSTVEGFIKTMHGIDLTKVNCVCIGEITAEKARSYGMNVQVSNKATIDCMIQKIKELSTRGH